MKLRGTANQIWDKYLALARDAGSAGDRVSAENYYQHAEHYYRLMTINGQAQNQRPTEGQADSPVMGAPVGGGNGAPAPVGERRSDGADIGEEEPPLS